MLRHVLAVVLLTSAVPSFASIELGPERPLTPPGFESATGAPLIASNGSESLAVWAGNYSTFALPLSRGGTALTARAIPIDRPDSAKRLLDLTTDGKDFLAVTISALGGIRALRIETASPLHVIAENTVVAAPLPNAYFARAALAWNGRNYLFAYISGYTDPLSGILLDRSGAPAGAPFPIGDGAPEEKIAVASNGDGFIVAATRGKDLRTFAVSAAGVVMPPFEFAANEPMLPHRAIVWTGRTYVFVWNEGIDQYFRSVNEVTLDALGAPTRGATVIASGVADARPFSRTVISTGDGAMALIEGIAIGAVRIDANGDPIDTAPVLLIANPRPQNSNELTMDAAWDGSSAFAVWQHWDGAPIIYGANVDFARFQDGSPLAQAAYTERAAAVGAAGRTQIVVTAESGMRPSNPIFFIQALINGEPVGRKVRLSDGDDVRTPSIATDGVNFLVLWSEATDQRSKARIVTADGSAGPVIDIAPGSDPLAAWTGTHYLVYTTESSGGWQQMDQHLLAIRVSPSGQLLDPTPQRIDAAPAFRTGGARVVRTPQGLTAVFRHGEQAWFRWSTFLSYDLYAARVSPSGEFLTTPVRITTTEESEGIPEVAAAPDGTLFVTWVASGVGYQFSSFSRGAILSPQLGITPLFESAHSGASSVAWTGTSFLVSRVVGSEVQLERYSERAEKLPIGGSFDAIALADDPSGTGFPLMTGTPSGALAVFMCLMPEWSGSDAQRVVSRMIYDLGRRREVTPR